MADGGKTPLMLVPGLLCTADLYADQLKGLADVADMRVARHTGHASMAGIAEELLASAPEKFAIAGLSMGGYGAVLHAVSRPDLFAAAFSLSGSLFSEQAADIEARKTAYGRIFGGVFGEPFETARFLDWNVFMRLDKRADEINRLAFWLAAGDDDFASILGGTVRFHQELRRRGIASELRVMDGGHEWALWSRALDPALSWLSPRLKPDC